MTPELAVLEAVLGLVRDDAAVVAIVGEKGFDEVPADAEPAEPPYLACGPVNRLRVEGGLGKIYQIRLRLFAASTEFGRDQVWELADAAGLAIDEKRPDLAAGFELVDELVV